MHQVSVLSGCKVQDQYDAICSYQFKSGRPLCGFRNGRRLHGVFVTSIFHQRKMKQKKGRHMKLWVSCIHFLLRVQFIKVEAKENKGNMNNEICVSESSAGGNASHPKAQRRKDEMWKNSHDNWFNEGASFDHHKYQEMVRS